MARKALLTLLAASAVGARLSAQSLPAPQVDYALTNVRIVAAPGRVIERGAILVRNGRIAAVGPGNDSPEGCADDLEREHRVPGPH
jgi:imidazolonepropionase-like amidohydrolase